jgi:hypothetical protein
MVPYVVRSVLNECDRVSNRQASRQGLDLNPAMKVTLIGRGPANHVVPMLKANSVKAVL